MDYVHSCSVALISLYSLGGVALVVAAIICLIASGTMLGRAEEVGTVFILWFCAAVLGSFGVFLIYRLVQCGT